MVNEQTVYDKIFDLLHRNYDRKVQMKPYLYSKKYEMQNSHLFIFKRSQFTNIDLSGIFAYVKLNIAIYLAEWRVEALSHQNVQILLWIYDEPQKLQDVV